MVQERSAGRRDRAVRSLESQNATRHRHYRLVLASEPGESALPRVQPTGIPTGLMPNS